MKNYLTIKNFLAASIFASLFINVQAFATQAEQAYTTVYRYNLLGQVTGKISPDPDGSGNLRLLATRNTYESGVLIKVENGELLAWPSDEYRDVSTWEGFVINSKQIFGYDNYGRKTSATTYDKSGASISVIEYKYDTSSRVLCQATRMNLVITGDACSSSNTTGANPDRISRFTYNDYDQLLQEDRALGTSLQQAYTRNTYGTTTHRLDSQFDANGNRTDLRYDSNGRLERMVYPSTSIPITGQVNESDYVSFTYDANGNKTSERKRSGAVINYTVDNNNRVILKDYVNAAMKDISYTYDLRGLQLSAKFVSDGKGITSTYDGFGSIASSTNSMFDTPRSLTYSYDLNGNRTTITHPDNVTFTYEFDGLNRVSNLKDNSSSSLLSVTYQSNGRRASLNRSNGTSTTYSFQNGVQLSSFQQSFTNSSSNNLKNDFTYNNAGQIATLAIGNTRYYYNGNENRVGDYVTDGLNRYRKVGAAALDYDGNSNLKYDGLTYYNYDDENRLTSMTKLDDSTFTPSFVYDPNGRLFKSIVDGQTRQFLYDGDALVLKYDGNSVSRRYVNGDQVDEPLVQYGTGTAVSDRLYLHADHQGSIIARTNSAGAVMTTAAYDAYGVSKDESTDSSGFGYTGQIYFKSLELDYYKARFYSPKLGRFLQTDPIGYKDNMNLYAYVENDPLNMSDPTGTMSYADAGKVFGGRAITAGITSQLDSPVPGPADVVAIGILIFSVGELAVNVLSESNDAPKSPDINPGEVAGKTPEEIGKIATDNGLIPQGPNPQAGQGSYTDPVTGRQRILIHPDADCGAHCHVNDPEGNRLDENGNKVAPESPEAHLPLKPPTP